MQSPKIKFSIYDFYEDIPENKRVITSFKEENLSDGKLLDNLFILRFLTFEQIKDVFSRKYKAELVWFETDPTPGVLKTVAEQFGVLISLGEKCIVYIPISTVIDVAQFELTLPKFKFEYKFILDCNLSYLSYGGELSTLSMSLFDFRPLLVLRRLLLDCMSKAGTDIHFVSSYENKNPVHKIQYRIQRELYDSTFKIDGTLMTHILNKLISLKSTTSPVDLDSLNGVTTDVSNIFDDETVDLRVTGSRVSAGYYMVIAIQQVLTTSKTIDQLGFFDEDVQKLRYLASKNEGLILHTGKMRSGKNTTIFAMINEKVRSPIRIIEYSNPIELRMQFPQVNYKGDISALKNLMRLAKKEDIDFAVLNEIPNSEVAFAVRDLVNSAIGVMTTTHLNRVYHLPYKLQELYGKDYKNIISQLTAVINHRMLRRQKAAKFFQKSLTGNEEGFLKFAYDMGVRTYYEPDTAYPSALELQPIVEILIFDEDLKTELLNHETLYESEQLIKKVVTESNETLEAKIVRGINDGTFNIQELYQFY